MGSARLTVKAQAGAIIATMTISSSAGLRRVSRWLAAAAAGWLALPGVRADAAPHGAAATRAELASWLDELRAGGATDVSRPISWLYLFSSPEGRRLEELSVELVGAGYSIATLAPHGEGTRLAVARTELNTPASLERRNRDFTALARRHGVRYEGVDLAPKL